MIIVPYSFKSSRKLFVNGIIHWLVQPHDSLCVIIAFDVMKKRLFEIPLSHDLAIALKSKSHMYMP